MFVYLSVLLVGLFGSMQAVSQDEVLEEDSVLREIREIREAAAQGESASGSESVAASEATTEPESTESEASATEPAETAEQASQTTEPEMAESEEITEAATEEASEMAEPGEMAESAEMAQEEMTQEASEPAESEEMTQEASGAAESEEVIESEEMTEATTEQANTEPAEQPEQTRPEIAVEYVMNTEGAAGKRVLFGDLHVHTALSFDAYLFGNRNSPEDAYRYAKGETIRHSGGFGVKLEQPLDFQAVTDHAIYLGMLPAMFDPNSPVGQHPLSVQFRSSQTLAERISDLAKLRPFIEGNVSDSLLDMNIVRSAWLEVIEAAERHNEPGVFTTFIGYEYSLNQDRFETLDRNVIFADAGVPNEPFSKWKSRNPEDLWSWMDDLRLRGIDSIAIPHNSNGSDGFMFRRQTHFGDDIDEIYSDIRRRNEPLVEVTQTRGTSETHPLLSSEDEFANFEIMPYQTDTWYLSQPMGSYARGAYLDGLSLKNEGRGNPYKFGLIGSSDSHVAAGSFDESNYWSRTGLVDVTPLLRGSVPFADWKEWAQYKYQRIRNFFRETFGDPSMRRGLPRPSPAPDYTHTYISKWSASGLAAVWAEENTRESIFAAMKRKEVFATSGPRLRIRFFAGYDFGPDILNDAGMIEKAYAQGVPMGGDLFSRPDGEEPEFLIWATRDPASASLQRLQLIKGWIDDSGSPRERVYDVACAGGQPPDPKTHRCPDNNSRVDLKTCTHSADSGSDALRAHWRDPEFNPNQRAFYYVRVLENETCRWSTWDAVRAGTTPNPSLPATLQERAWSSPIWYEI